jgi:hypothetical protein
MIGWQETARAYFAGVGAHGGAAAVISALSLRGVIKR